MRKIMVVLALATCVGCTNYKPYVNSPQEHLLMGDHLPLNVQDKLRPMYRSCTPEELVDMKTAQQIEVRQYKCSAVILQHDDWLHLVNWEAPADISGQPQGALVAGFAVLQAAQKYKIASGTISSDHNVNRSSGGSFEFCEVHATDTEAMHWEQGKCWNTPASTAVDPPKHTSVANPMQPPARTSVPTPLPISRQEVQSIVKESRYAGDLLPKIQPTLQHVFGADVSKFTANAVGAASLQINGDIAFYQGCSIEEKCAKSAVVVIDLTDGKAAGAISDDAVHVYPGDYLNRDAFPESLKEWLRLAE